MKELVFSWRSPSSAILRILPLRSDIGAEVSATCEVRPVSSRKFHACTSLGEDGSASDTRLCFSAEEEVGEVGELEEERAGKGAEKEKVAVVGGLQEDSADSDMAKTRQRLELDETIIFLNKL